MSSEFYLRRRTFLSSAGAVGLNRATGMLAVTSVGAAGLAGADPGAASAEQGAAGGVLLATSPATDWESGAFPIGNARLGAMLFSGIGTDRIQLNEQSLWGGLNNYDNALAGQGDGAYDTSVRGFGSYRNFGELTVAFSGFPEPGVRPGGTYQDSWTNETIAQTIDGNKATKWCIIGPPSQVIWIATLPAPAALTSYSITSANDVPARDPQRWRFEGSNDGTTWQLVDERNIPPFEQRGQTKTFSFANTTAYGHYRFVFSPIAGVSHFQVAEVTLTDVSFSNPVPADYRRVLDPSIGVHHVEFTRSGHGYAREAFASREADFMVFRYVTDAPGGMSGTIRLVSGQDADPGQPKAQPSAAADGTRIGFVGAMTNDLAYAAEARIRAVGGSTDGGEGAVTFSGCSELEIRLDLRTNYKLDAAAGWRRPEAPADVAVATLDAARSRSYTQLRDQHVAAFAAIMSRVALAWGDSPAETASLPISQRITRYGDGGDDPELEVLTFHYGRYLLASSSRPDGLPANLQGLWNNSNQPPWASDYHTNINIQMNYWGAETASLSDSHLALVRFIEQVAVPSRVATRNAFGDVRGWTARTSQSAFGGNSWEWNTVSSAWYMQHVYEHWAFSQDRDHLRVAYPLVKEICEFWEDRLVEREVDGEPRLLAPDGWSPEHGPREDGVMHDQQIIWDLFTNYLELAAALAIDPAYQLRVADLRARLAPNKIGSWGQLQEWQADRDSRTDLHRHTSHLFAVFPGRQIDVRRDAALAAAALTSLNARCGVPDGGPIGVDTVSGDSRRSWTWPWRAALFARLAEPEKAHVMLRGLLRHNTLANLFTTHPPFQMDGNFGITGAMAEMLVQSHGGVIRILPALPPAWADGGSFAGLRARGGHRVDATWADGRVTAFHVTSDRVPFRKPVQVEVNGTVQTVVPEGTAPLARTSTTVLQVKGRKFRVGETVLVTVKVPEAKVGGGQATLWRDGVAVDLALLGSGREVSFEVTATQAGTVTLQAQWSGTDAFVGSSSEAVQLRFA